MSHSGIEIQSVTLGRLNVDMWVVPLFWPYLVCNLSQKAPDDQISCPFQLWNIYVKMLFWNHWSAKLQLQLSDRDLSSLWLGVQPECEPISSRDCSPGHRAALCWWYASLKYRWVMCVSNHVQRFHRTLSWFAGQGTRKQTSDKLWIFKGMSSVCCYCENNLYIAA